MFRMLKCSFLGIILQFLGQYVLFTKFLDYQILDYQPKRLTSYIQTTIICWRLFDSEDFKTDIPLKTQREFFYNLEKVTKHRRLLKLLPHLYITAVVEWLQVEEQSPRESDGAREQPYRQDDAATRSLGDLAAHREADRAAPLCRYCH